MCFAARTVPLHAQIILFLSHLERSSDVAQEPFLLDGVFSKDLLCGLHVTAFPFAIAGVWPFELGVPGLA